MNGIITAAEHEIYLPHSLTPHSTHLADDVAYAWRLKNSGEKAWSEETTVAPGAAKNSKPVYKEHFAH